MSRQYAVVFRGEERAVTIDYFEVDFETNAVELEWHFDGVSPEQHEELVVTPEEDEAIVTRLLVLVEESND